MRQSYLISVGNIKVGDRYDDLVHGLGVVGNDEMIKVMIMMMTMLMMIMMMTMMLELIDWVW